MTSTHVEMATPGVFLDPRTLDRVTRLAAPPVPVPTTTTAPDSVIPAPFAGQPATVRLYTDTRAAVVTKVSPSGKTITVHRVETTDMVADERCDEGAYGARPMRADGILDKIIEGSGQTFRQSKHGEWRNGSTRLRLGSSVTWVDYRF